uniref:Putative kinetochore protein nuf2 n=1 Tax=Lygus hesperus TaxID=30085 RepID=A0A0A9YID9_LYGHE
MPSIQNTVNIQSLDMYNNYAQFIVLHEIVYFMKSMGIHNFSLRDITNPEPNRTLSILSAVMNYMKFHSSFLQIYEDATNETSEIYERKGIVEQEYQKLVDELERLQQRCEEYKPTIEAHTADVNASQNRIGELDDAIGTTAQNNSQVEGEIETTCAAI